MTLPQTRRGWLIVAAVAAVLALGWIFAARNSPIPAAASLPEAPFAGNRAPAFALVDSAGNTVQLSDWHGRPVVLNFWASWCGPCRVETPFFQAMSEQYGDAVAIVGINQGESQAVVERFAAEYGLTYPLLLDEDQRINRLYSVFGLPTTLFIDAEGVVQEVYPGAISQASLEERIEKLRARP